ncbi:carboxymuconolactone decarboxylase [Corticibacter populi]|uniref:Carboxymuconolactone decarboxylase n=1 Tax=Corticibacter populi TaxID=1550736 RepID=A0A3M6QRE3_9BURK|nr:peroxidase-related enzyme [Corticibacter populi]RMX04972.1 carboxymuconolactone decarboxylase [Corticibacter populi]RZS33599.1 putative peroxidase-related enzyme [Corticibacter populi]
MTPDAPSSSTSATLLEQLASIAPETAAAQVLRQRQKVVSGVQNCFELFFPASTSTSASPGADADLTPAERLFAATLVARQADSPALAAHYSQGLQALATAGAADARQVLQALDAPRAASARLQAIARFTQSVAADPAAAAQQAPEQLAALRQAGLDAPAIVLLAQLIGFVSFQLRLLAGWQAWRQLAEHASAATQALPETDAGFVHPARLPPPGSVLRIHGFTNETLDWHAWLPVLDVAQASAEQNAILDASHPKARSSDFYLLLALQPAILGERSSVFNTIMYAPGGLPRAERELATAVVSRINRCVYCLSVHAQRFEQLAKRNDVVAQLFADPHSTGTNARERAVAQLAAALTEAPAKVRAETLAPLQAAGATPLEVLDAINASALFAWANRLMLNLGEAVQPAS